MKQFRKACFRRGIREVETERETLQVESLGEGLFEELAGLLPGCVEGENGSACRDPSCGRCWEGWKRGQENFNDFLWTREAGLKLFGEGIGNGYIKPRGPVGPPVGGVS